MKFKNYYKATVTQAGWYWCTARRIKQHSRTESPNLDPHINGQLIFDRGAKTVW